MVGKKHFVASLLVLAGLGSAAFGQDPRVVTENGVQYRETREKFLRPVTEVQYEDRERTVYREELATETRESERVILTPVTEYEWEPYWVNRWNPFREPYVGYRLSPRTRMEAHTAILRTPIVSRRLVPERRVERVPVISRRMVEEEVIRRMAVAPGPVHTSVRVVDNDIGGRQLSSDPPRETTSLEWRPAGGTRGRY
jgi:hypothetical protein